MFKSPSLRCFQLGIVLGLFSGLFSFGQTPSCPAPPNRIAVNIDVSVAFNSAKGMFTYSYVVSNNPSSSQDVDGFYVDFQPPVSNLMSPTGWTSGSFSNRSTLGWGATFVSDTTPDDGISVPPSAVQIKLGMALSGFSFDSPNAPGYVKYYVTGFSPTPVQQEEEEAEALVEACPANFGSILDLAVVGSTVGPTNALPVLIDIKPGSFPNIINPGDQGVVPVAVLGSSSFDVTKIDTTSLRFGRNAAPPSHQKPTIQDVNGDGIPDLLVHFPVPAIGLRCNDTALFLLGNTVGGAPFGGADSVVTVGCH